MKVVDHGKLAFIGRNEREPMADGLSSDKQIVSADCLSFMFETGAEHAVHEVGGFFKGQYFDGAEHGLDLSSEARRSPLGGPETQLGSYNNAGRHLRFTYIANAVRYAAVRIPD